MSNEATEVFMLEALGSQVWSALQKSEAARDMSALWFPRVLAAWLELAKAEKFHGKIPGLDVEVVNGAYLRLGKQLESLQNLSNATAVVLVKTDYNPELATLAKAADWSKLGLFFKAATKKNWDKSLQKTSLPGKSAEAREPVAPVAPAPQSKQPAFEKSEATFTVAALKKGCRDCGYSHLAGKKFVGCLCLADDVALGSVDVLEKSETSFKFAAEAQVLRFLGSKIVAL